MSSHLVIPDPHAHPEHHNKRAEWVGHLITDLKPDVVVVLGDTADMPSLCSYDRGKKSFQGRSYKKDIDAHGDFQERLWGPVRKAKRKLPRTVTLIGNHEERIGRAIEIQPELEHTIGYDDLQLEQWYDDIVHYNGATPGAISIDGVTYAHYLVSGVACRPISGDNMGASLLAKQHSSCTVGHIHTFDYAIRTRADGKRIAGCAAGVYQDFNSGFAGLANNLWWRGVIFKSNVEDGNYDLRAISLNALKKEYGGRER